MLVEADCLDVSQGERDRSPARRSLGLMVDRQELELICHE